jgi:Protein of unknown function (DUF2911)
MEKRMNLLKTFGAFGLMLTFLLLLPVARASENDQATKITFDHDVQIPGRVLPAGTYWFVLPEDISRHFLVHIYNSDGTVLITTLLTASVEREKSTDKTEITFAERDPMQPEAIVTWFYPGRAIGHEFLYSKQEAKELALSNRQTIVVGD